MKKMLFLLAFELVSVHGFSQDADSLAVIAAVDSLIHASQSLTDAGALEEAMELADQAQTMALEAFGENHPTYASSQYNMGYVFHFMANFDEAEKAYLTAKDIREKVFGKENPIYREGLNNLILLYEDQGHFEQAEAISKEDVSIVERMAGKESPEYAKSLGMLGSIYWDMGRYDTTEVLWKEAKDLLEKVSGRESFDYGSSIGNLANLYATTGRFEEAEALFLESIHVYEKLLGKESPEYASNLSNLASLYFFMGRYEAAEKLHLEAKAILEKALGKEHPDYALCLSNLASLYRAISRLDEAEQLGLEVKSIWEKAYGKEHTDYALSVHNLGILYAMMGQYEKAEQSYLEAKSIWEKTVGKETLNYVATLEGLALLYQDTKRSEAAEAAYDEVLEIREKILGKEQPDYASSLLNLANLYFSTGRYATAEPRYLEAKDIYEKTLGKEQPDYAHCLYNLANNYFMMQRFETAEALYLEAKSTWEKVLGKEHSDYVDNLNSLATFYEFRKRYAAADSLFSEAKMLQHTLLIKATRHLSELELNEYMRLFTAEIDKCLSVAQNRPGSKGQLPEICFDHLLFHKGFLLNTGLQIKNVALQDTAIARKYELFVSYHRRLAAEYAKPIAERGDVGSLENKANDQEKALARTVSGFGESLRQVAWNEVRNKLHAGEAAVELTHFQFYGDGSNASDSTLYAALILRPQDSTPQYIYLFEEKQLQHLLDKTESRDESVNALYAARSGELLEKRPKYGTELYNLIWRPLDTLLSDVKTIYYSPSGLLHRVNLAALPTGRKKVLADRFNLHQMGSTRDLVVKTKESVPARYFAALYGGILYSSDSTASAVGVNAESFASNRGSFEYVTDVQRDTMHNWKYLPGTRTEIIDLQNMLTSAGLRSQSFTSVAATEESLKALGCDTVKSPDILHIATHGFFFSDPEKRQHQVGDDNVFRWNENPLFRSGLILAGADHAWQTGHPYKGREDGILTAYEISHLNLSNTKLAVLSACETGLGDIKGSEGVYGLQRAFKMAGVDYLMVSLWKVPDAQTGEFMNRFYKFWLGGMPIHDAFTKAQRKMRKKYGVYEWGAWMLIE